MVTVAIFSFITAFLAIKYGNANQGIIVTNLAYDIAITIRQAQSYGLNVKEGSSSCTTSGVSGTFQCAYGVYISSATSPAGLNKQFIFFVDRNGNKKYDASEEISAYQMKRNIYLNRICTDMSCTATITDTHITFLRPNPDAVLYYGATPSVVGGGLVKLELASPDGSKKYIVVRKTGQISIED